MARAIGLQKQLCRRSGTQQRRCWRKPKAGSAQLVPPVRGSSSSSGSQKSTLDRIVNSIPGIDADTGTLQLQKDGQALLNPVQGSRRLSNYFWATVVTAGASGFFINGLSSYFGKDLAWFTDAQSIQFVPQGLVLCFYGTAGLLLASYLWLTILWDVGGGYNEFDKSTNTMRIFRRGFPGKNRRVVVDAPLDDVKSVKVDVQEGLNPRRALYVSAKGRADLPLTRIGTPIPLDVLEDQAAELARFLQVPIEGGKR